jgi:hypothetical protein
MSEGKNLGISKTMFIVGLIIAILASSLISTLVAMQWLKGLKGDKGDTGATGPQGPQGLKGDKGDPGNETVFAYWDVNWRTISGSLQWGAVIGTSMFCSTFNYNWGSGDVYGAYADYIGFDATMQVKMSRNGPVTFTVGGDDNFWFYVDGALTISGSLSWGISKTIYLSQGTHTLTLWWYDVTGTALVIFNCDSDIVMWNP